ncbi:MAG TPA: class III extradiol ring-cleavage dioxygenase [Steroidobacteraceae bacterium]|nr:class III extradiol ring-cleavage dioxygenase [Steroidobacteraceae bacterium]
MPDASARLPTFFIPHGGGPCFFMDWDYPTPNPWTALAGWLTGLAASIQPRPRAVLVISGHWEEAPLAINVQEHAPLLYDYYGFPAHTYQLRYPAPGSPALAQEVRELLSAAGFDSRAETRRGLDHGVFVPFKLIYPQADMPIVQLSLQSGLDPSAHLRLGAALAPLRERGVLIVGSGMSFHNLAIRSIENARIPQSEAFDTWLTQAVCAPDPAERSAQLTRWAAAPSARFAHPREEHLLPLMVAAGAAGTDTATHAFSGRMLGWQISGYRFGTMKHLP